jgi:hypothetical protein
VTLRNATPSCARLAAAILSYNGRSYLCWRITTKVATSSPGPRPRRQN